MILSFVSNNLFAQEKSTLSETNLVDKTVKQNSAANNQTSRNSLSTPSSTLKGLANILPQPATKIDSLMFDDKESGNISHVIELLKNNQIYGTDENIENAEDQKNTQENKAVVAASNEIAKSYIYLGSIIYLNSNEWAVWINGKKITPEINSKDKEIYLESVQRDQVKISWTPSISKWKILLGQKSGTLSPKINEKNEVEMEFSLKPNQSFVLKNNDIVEGVAKEIATTEGSAAIVKKSSKTTDQNNKPITKQDNSATISSSNQTQQAPKTSDQGNSATNSNINKSISAITDKLKGIIPTNPSGTAIPDSEF